MTLYVGIDPGALGALVALHADSSLYGAWRTPASPGEMAALIRDLPQVKLAVIEKVHSMPGQGVSSTFTFGRNVGTWIGILASFGVPYLEITPQKWMRCLPSMPASVSIPAALKGSKEGARLRSEAKKARKMSIVAQARARWPELPIKTQADWGIGDASFLALYGVQN